MQPLDKQLAEVFSAVFGVDKIDDFISVTTLEEWDSLSHITLILALEEKFNISFSLDEAIEIISVAEIKRVLISKGIQV